VRSDAAPLPSPSPRPLAGIRVLDLSRVVSGPYAGRILADLGADVVKVESPAGDITQFAGMIENERSGSFAQMNAGKRSIGIDLDADGSTEIVRSLAAECDVVIENFRPSVLPRRGLGWADLSAINPRLVMLSISGFGATSGYSERRAYAPVIHAESGLLARYAELDGRMPSDIPLALGDVLSSLHGSIAVLAALRLRDVTGVGQHIDMSMLDAMVASDDYQHFVVDDRIEPYPTRGTVWQVAGGPLLLAASAKHAWAEISRQRGLRIGDDVAADVDAKIAARRTALEEWFANFSTRQEVLDELDRLGLAWADIVSPDDVLRSPAFDGRQISTRPDGPGTRAIVRMPYNFSAATSGPTRGAATTGQDTDDVLREWIGLGDDAIRLLRSTGALFTQEDQR